jgi:hypothetical protein
MPYCFLTLSSDASCHEAELSAVHAISFAFAFLYLADISFDYADISL